MLVGLEFADCAGMVFVLRPAFAIAVPAFGLAWFLSQSDPGQRAAVATSLRERLGFAASQPPATGIDRPPRPVGPAAAPQPVALGPDTFAVDADRGGQFETTMLIHGRELPALIDTGATYVALTFDDAASIGIHPANSDFRYAAQTANGVSRSAAVVIPEIRVGNVEARNVQAFVSQPGALTGRSLLGMSFLRKLSGFEIQSGRLVLRQ